MAISQKVSVTTDRKTIAPVVYAVQGDTGRQIVAEYSDFQLASGMTGVFAFTRSDGTSYSVPATIDPAANTATAEMDQALTQVGKTKGQIKITDSSGLGSTFTFYIDAQENLSGTPTEQQYYDIQAAVEAAAEAKAEADQVLEDLGPISQINDRLTDAEEELDNKADIDGTYPSLTAGLAEQLLSSNRVVDQTPYLYRQTALGKANATRALMKKIVGGSVVWNQLCNGSSVTVPSGHKYAAKIGGSWSISASAGTAITGLTAGTDIVTDLTALFGSATIADYIYNLETATEGSGIAKLREWGFFTEDYYEYDAGTMKSVEGLQAKETTGKNLANFVDGYGIDNNGNPTTQVGRIATLEPIYIKEGQSYKFVILGASKRSLYAVWNGNTLVRRITNIRSGETINTSGGTHFYICVYDDVTVESARSMVVLSTETDLTYKPYTKHTYPLDSSLTLRGIPKLDSDNNLYYDGDVYASDGTVTRRYGIVDLGTLNWTYRSAKACFNANLTVKGGTVNMPSDIICTKYVSVNSVNYSAWQDNPDKSIFTSPNDGYLVVRDTGYTDAATFKTAMSGIYAVYPLATEATETAEPYTEVQVVDKDGTEQFVTTGIVPVGHVTEYPEDLVGKIDELPDLPETAGSYVLRVTVTSGKASYEWVSA